MTCCCVQSQVRPLSCQSRFMGRLSTPIRLAQPWSLLLPLPLIIQVPVLFLLFSTHHHCTLLKQNIYVLAVPTVLVFRFLFAFFPPIIIITNKKIFWIHRLICSVTYFAWIVGCYHHHSDYMVMGNPGVEKLNELLLYRAVRCLCLLNN